VGDGSGVCAFSTPVINKQKPNINRERARFAGVEAASKKMRCLKCERPN